MHEQLRVRYYLSILFCHHTYLPASLSSSSSSTIKIFVFVDNIQIHRVSSFSGNRRGTLAWHKRTSVYVYLLSLCPLLLPFSSKYNSDVDYNNTTFRFRTIIITPSQIPSIAFTDTTTTHHLQTTKWHKETDESK